MKTLIRMKKCKIMNKIDRIIKESIDRLVNETKYNYKNQYAKMRAASHTAEKKGDVGAIDRCKDWFARNAAITDINKELAAKRKMALDTYDKSDYEFNTPMTPGIFNDAEDWLKSRDINDLDY